MPIVPTQTLRSVGPASLPGPTQSPLPASAFGTIAAEQTGALASAAMGYAQGQAKIEISMLDEANKLRVEEAVNRARQDALNLAYDEKVGYLSQKGANAIYRASGKDLSGEYLDRYKESLATIGGSLNNTEQQRMFNERAGAMVTSFQGDVQRHQLNEYTQHAISVHDGSAKLATESAMKNWQDPARIGTDIADAKAAISRANAYRGVSANETQFQIDTIESRIHERVIDTALQENNPAYALQYLQKNKERMSTNDILKVNARINHDLDARGAQAAVSAASAEMAPRFAPPNENRLLDLVAQQESGSRDFGENGAPIVSPKGAKYKMQVMPDTAKAPGFGVKPAASDSPEEYNRVGREYMGALLKQYGNLNMSLAAYNAGPARVEDAMKKAKAAGNQNNWMAYMPKETQDYVTAISQKYTAGEGAPTPPTKGEFIAAAVAKLGPEARPSTINMAREAAAKQFGVIQESLKDQVDQTMQQVQRALIANGGDLSRVSPGLMSQLATVSPGKFDDAKKFGEAIAKGDNKTNDELYLNLVVYPEELAKMRDSEFMQLRTQLSKQDFDRFAKRREDILSGKDDMSAGALNEPIVLQTAEERFKAIGVNVPKRTDDTKDSKAYGARLKYIRDELYAQQKQLGRKMTPEETRAAVDGIFAKDTGFQDTFFGINVGTKPKMKAGIGDIPEEDLKEIITSLKKDGIVTPNDSDILRRYLRGRR